MLARGNQVPPPGYYFDPKKASTFKVQETKIEMQCFNSSVHRFQEPVKDTPGPGHYDVRHLSDVAVNVNALNNGQAITSVIGGIKFGTGPKGLDFVAMRGNKDIPGPGLYQLKAAEFGFDKEIKEN